MEAFARLNRQYADRNMSLVKLSAVFRPLMTIFHRAWIRGDPLIGGR